MAGDCCTSGASPSWRLDAIFIPVLFTLLFTYLFGGALSGSPREYLQFLLPGTLVLTVLLITVTAGAEPEHRPRQGHA